jgi:hypothetical protein
MTTSEDRLRDALAAVADLVQPATALPRSEAALSAPGQDRTRSGGQIHRLPPRWRQRYVPIATAAAVLLTVAASILIRPVRNHGSQDTLDVAVPARYYVTNVEGPGVSVHDVRTGKVTAMVKPPALSSWSTLSATADPHVFFLASTARYVRVVPGQPRVRRLNVADRFYRLDIDDAGRARSLKPTAVTIPANASVPTSIAASPDGARIAYPNLIGQEKMTGLENSKAGYGPAEIDVVNLSTGRRAAFRAPTWGGLVESLSWAADGRHLAYQIAGAGDGSAGVWILDTRGGRDLRAGSRHVVTYHEHDYTSPVLSADGRHVYLIADNAGHGGRTTQVIELDARTGKRQRVLYEEPFNPAGGNVSWTFTELARDPAGTSLLAVDDLTHAHRIDIATGHVTNFHYAGGAPNAIAW